LCPSIRELFGLGTNERRIGKLEAISLAIVLCLLGCTEIAYDPPQGIHGLLYIQRGYSSVDRIDMATGVRESIPFPAGFGRMGFVDLNMLPDKGTFLALSRPEEAYVALDLEGNLIAVAPDGFDGKTMRNLSLSPDGMSAVYFDAEGRLMFRNLASGRTKSTEFRGWSAGPRPAWIGEHAVLVHATGTTGEEPFQSWTVDQETGNAALFERDIVICSPYNPLLKAALCSTSDGTFFELGEGREQRVIVRRRFGMDPQPCWSPDHRWIAYTRRHDRFIAEGPRALYVMEAATGAETQVSMDIADSCFWVADASSH